jgi:hypothetical protein
MRAVFAWLAIFCFVFSDLAPAARAFADSYLPLAARALSRRLRQKLVADPLEAGQTLCVQGTRIEIKSKARSCPAEGPTLQVHGEDNAGKVWSYVSSAWTGFASVWTADLDKNGKEDLIILMRSGNCPPEPTSQLLVLMFEKNGRPVPWVVDGYFEIDARGIKDFVDLENDGHCQLIRQSFDRGYWMTSFYEAHQSRWQRLSTIAGIKLPLYTRFTLRENHESVCLPERRRPSEPDLSNNCADPNKCRRQTFLDGLDWPDSTNHEYQRLVFSDGKRFSPAAGSLTMTVVIEDVCGRRMASSSAAEATGRLLAEIRSRRMPVSLSGQRARTSRCRSFGFLMANCPGGPEKYRVFCRQARSLDLALTGQNERAELP